MLVAAACSPSPEPEGSGSIDGEPADLTDPGCGDIPCVAAAAPGATEVAYHRVIVTDRGEAWVTWVETADLRVVGMYMAVSPSVGAPFGLPIEVPTAEPPVVGGTEKPAVDLHGSRLAIAHTGVGALRHGDAVAVYVLTAELEGGGIRFDEPVLIDLSNVRRFVAEHAQVALTEQDLWLAYKRQVYGFRDIPTVARASLDYVPDVLSDALSREHECSPPHLLRTGDDGLVYALRSNVDGRLQTVVVPADGEAFGSPVQVSDSRWAYRADVCPPDGPRLAEHPDGTLLVVWVAPLDGALRTFRSWSTDRGATWTEPELDHAPTGFSERLPSVLAVPGGDWLTAVTADGEGARLYRRSALGEEPREEPLTGPEGLPLTEVELATGGGRTVAAGLAEGRLWLVDLRR